MKQYTYSKTPVLFYRPEDTHKGITSSYHCDLNMLYWSEEGNNLRIYSYFTLKDLNQNVQFYNQVITISHGKPFNKGQYQVFLPT